MSDYTMPEKLQDTVDHECNKNRQKKCSVVHISKARLLYDQIKKNDEQNQTGELQVQFEQHYLKLLILLNNSSIFPAAMRSNWIRTLKGISFRNIETGLYILDKVYYDFTEACVYIDPVKELLKLNKLSKAEAKKKKHNIRHEFSWLAYLLKCAS